MKIIKMCEEKNKDNGNLEALVFQKADNGGYIVQLHFEKKYNPITEIYETFLDAVEAISAKYGVQ